MKRLRFNIFVLYICQTIKCLRARAGLHKNTTKYVISLLIIIGIIALDQYSKLWVVEYLQQHNRSLITLTSFLNLALVLNKGISFGLFNSGEYNNYIFLAIATSVTITVVYLLIQAQTLIAQISYSLIIGGAIGNIIDRYLSGAVIDFIELHVGQAYWPAFNIADSSICIGALLLLYDIFTNDLTTKKKL